MQKSGSLKGSGLVHDNYLLMNLNTLCKVTEVAFLEWNYKQMIFKSEFQLYNAFIPSQLHPTEETALRATCK